MASTRKTLSDFDLNGHQLKQGGTNVFNTSRGAGQSPLAGGDGRVTPWLSGFNTTTLYASPNGSNANDGTTWATAKKTCLSAYDALPSGGGTIEFKNNTQWSDGTEGGGATLNGPVYLTNELPVSPGFRAYKPLTLRGVPAQVVGGFMTQGKAQLAIDGGPLTSHNDRFHPMMWFVGTTAGMRIENVQLPGFPWQAIRIGWDYPRDGSGNLLLLNVDTAARASGLTTFTINTLYSTSVISASRVGGVVTLLATLPAGTTKLAWGSSPIIHLASTNGAFPTGTYTVDVQDTVGGNVQFTYTDGGSNQSSISLAGSTLTSHGLRENDRLDLVSTDAQWPTTMFRVKSVTLNTVTVFDPYGGHGSFSSTVTHSSIGQLIPQERYHYANALFEFKNVSAIIQTPNPENYLAGPTVDVGGGSTAFQYWKECNFGGYCLGDGTNLDEDRAAACLSDGGSVNSSSMIIDRMSLFNGHIRHYTNQAGSLFCRDVIQDGVGTVFPTVHISVQPNGKSVFGPFHILKNVGAADVTDAGVKLEGTEAHNTLVENSGLPIGDGACTLATPGPLWGTQGMSPDARGFQTLWPGGVTGRHPAALRSFSPLTPQFRNMIGPSSTWGLGVGITKTDGITAPDGTSGATRLSYASNGSFVSLRGFSDVDADGNAVTHQVGDRWAVFLWARSPSGLQANFGSNVGVGFGGANGNFSVSATTPMAGQTGWQFYSGGGVIQTVDTPNAQFTVTGLNFNSGQHVDIYQPVLVRVPAGVMDDNEWADFLRTCRQYDQYLRPGVCGTAPNQVLVGHGGLGSSKHAELGSGSGQVTLNPAGPQIAQEVFDESGASLGSVAVAVSTPSDFTPTSIAGCVLWLKADAGVTGTTNVSAWADQSGNGNDVTQGTGANQPSLSPISTNNRPAITFTNTQGLTRSSFIVPAGSARTVFMVCRAALPAGGGVLYGQGNFGVSDVWLSEFADIGSSRDAVVFASGTPGTDFAYFTPSIDLTIPVVYEQTRPAAGVIETQVKLAISGVAKTVVWNGGGGSTLNTEAAAITSIGNTNALANGFIGDISEVILFSRILTADEARQVRYYLAVRYALPLNGAPVVPATIGQGQGPPAASAGTLVLGSAYNYEHVTGTTAIDFVSTSGRQAGLPVTLYFASGITLNHNTTSPPANTAPLLLAGSANATLTAGTRVTIVFDVALAAWVEVSRTAP